MDEHGRNQIALIEDALAIQLETLPAPAGYANFVGRTGISETDVYIRLNVWDTPDFKFDVLVGFAHDEPKGIGVLYWPFTKQDGYEFTVPSYIKGDLEPIKACLRKLITALQLDVKDSDFLKE